MKSRLIINLLTFFVTILFICSSFSTTTSEEIQKNADKKKDKDITKLKWMGPHGHYEDYINRISTKAFSIESINETINNENNQLIIIFINSNLKPDINNEISDYSLSLLANGYNNIIIEVTGGMIEDLKSQILYYWNSGYNVTGVVLVGDHPAAWYYLEHDLSDFPCDLFLMDLDGKWTDTDLDGMYDSHTDGSGDTSPEIYVGRIDASNIPGDEIPITKAYFNKVNDFWAGKISHTDYGLTYTDKDWRLWDDFRFSIKYSYSNYDAIRYPNVDRIDYVNNRISNDIYEFIQIACHSWSNGHYFTNGGSVYCDEIRNALPKALFYNLFCCGALRFTDYNCLGNAYILDTNSPSLSVIGSTKSGSMLDFQTYYNALVDHSLGKAFQQWFEYQYPYDDDAKMWFYGMTILGDPTLFTWYSGGSNIPSKPNGPKTGRPGISYTYFTIASDPEELPIYYKWDWDDGFYSDWLGPFESGNKAEASYTWKEQGSYNIRVKARNEHGIESDWSDPLSISMPRNKQYINKLIQRFLKNYRNSYPLVYQLLQKALRL
jgi:hypothetical protein